MVPPLVVVTAAGLAFATFAYAYVPVVLSRRPTGGPSRIELWALGIWWVGLSLATGALAARNLLALAGVETMTVHLMLLQAHVLGNSVALAGLVTYLLHLYTGHVRHVPAIAAFYLAHYLLATWLLFYSDPSALRVGPVRTSFEYSGPSAATLVPLLVLVFYLPQCIAAIAYASLARHLPDRASRRRVLVVASCTLLWTVSTIAEVMASERGYPALEVVAQLLALVLPLGILAVYVAPAPLRRLGFRPANEPT